MFYLICRRDSHRNWRRSLSLFTVRHDFGYFIVEHPCRAGHICLVLFAAICCSSSILWGGLDTHTHTHTRTHSFTHTYTYIIAYMNLNKYCPKAFRCLPYLFLHLEGREMLHSTRIDSKAVTVSPILSPLAHSYVWGADTYTWSRFNTIVVTPVISTYKWCDRKQ